ncbi:hypothetical protein MNBD_BACTEROID03-2656 [hydrothermal vent metagenome]|uniref:Uncharacterized protein n=1 Tax=hydrothermal vent metagenome TaxID=652676 RepID=A0A3B0TU96_9ZZZZ
MVDKLIQIALYKKGSKKNLGVFLGFPEKYATQRVNKIIENQNFKMEILKKLLTAAEVEAYMDMAITAEHDKIFAK